MYVRKWSAHVRQASRSKKGEQYYPRAFTAHLRKLHPHHMHNIAYCKRVQGPESVMCSLHQAGHRCSPHCWYTVDSLLLLHQILQRHWERRGGREEGEGGEGEGGRGRRGGEGSRGRGGGKEGWGRGGRREGRVRRGKEEGKTKGDWDAEVMSVNDEDISNVCVDTIYLSSILRHAGSSQKRQNWWKDISRVTLLDNEQLLHFIFPN